MKYFLSLIVVSFLFLINGQGQYSVSQSVDRLYYCNAGSVMKATGKVQSFSANTFNGFKYHFYYYVSGVYQEIGYFTATIVGGTMFTSYGNIQPTYFNGSLIAGAAAVINTGTNLWVSIDVPYSTFPNNNTGQQLAVDVEAIDQSGSTTSHSSKTLMSVPLLYTNPVTLSSPSINASATVVCSSSVTLNSSPNYAPYGFVYDWYKDGSLFQAGDATGSIAVASPGTYYAIVSDACQTATSSSVVISSGSLPVKPSIMAPAMPLCDGAAGTLTAIGTGGVYTWSTGTVAGAISVATAGTYTVHESNSCGAGPESDPVSVTTATTPVAPVVSNGNGNLLCNGQSATLTTAPASGGSIYWNTGAGGNSLSVSAAGTYYAYETNGCGRGANSNSIVISTNAIAPAPVLSVSGSETLCNGYAQTITTSPVSSGGVIHWSNGATGNSITVNSDGTYYAWETNGCGNSANSASLVITTMNTPVAPVVTPAGPLALCDGASTTLTSSGSVPANILWYLDGASTGHFGSTYTISSAGAYSTRELSSCGTSPESNTVTIVSNAVPPAPVLNVSGSILLCDGAVQTINTLPSTSGGVIHWSTGATGNNIAVTAPGNYYAYETNSSCGTGPNSTSVTINTLNTPVAPSVNPPTNQLLCNGATATLNASGNWVTWSNGATGNTLTTAVAGNYYAVDHNACGNSPASNVVAIATGNCPIPAPGTAFFICPGTTKLIDAGAGYDSYLWNTGATTQTITVGPGTYSVTVMKNGCSASSAEVTVSYYSVGAALISASGQLSFCEGGTVTLSASVGSSYLWSNGSTASSIVVNASGTYSVKVIDANGCGANSAPVTTVVTPLPVAAVAGSASVCQNSAAPVISFTGSGGTAPYTFQYRVNGAAVQTVTTVSGNSVSVAVPTTVAGTFVYSLVGVRESGSNACSNGAAGSATVVVNPLPSAAVSGTTVVCQNSSSPAILFTGSGATAPYTFTYTINGGSDQTVTTVSGNSIAVAVPTTAPGLFTYRLVSVKEAGGSTCTNAASGAASVLVNPLPTAMIVGNNTVCQNSVSPQVVFTGSGGTAPYTFSYKVNDGFVQTVATTTGNAFAIDVPTAAAGTWVFTLVAVQDASASSCTNSASGHATVVINPLPMASISGSTTVCQNSTAPVILFTGSGGTAPYTFSYKINGGSLQTITTTSGNSVTLSVPTSTPGEYVYSLISVQESSGTSCMNTASGTATVTVNQLSTASISGTASVCEYSSSPIIVFRGSGGVAPYTFYYTVNGGTVQTMSTTTGDTVSVAVPTSVSGFFTYALVGVKESSSTACVNTAGGSATIQVNPLPVAAIAGNTTICQNSVSPKIVFTCSGGTAPFTFSYRLNGGPIQTVSTDNGENSVAVEVPTNLAGALTYSLVSVQESGVNACVNTATSTATVVVNPLPAASVVGTTSVCQNAAAPLITFTGSDATAPYTFTFNINGGANQTISTVNGNSATVSVPTNIAGSFVYSLVSVQESSGLSCAAASSGSATVTINPLPTATIGGTSTVCQYGGSPSVVFTGSGATPPYTFTYTVNGSSDQMLSTVSVNSATIPAPTNVAGTFTYTLMAVQESSGTGCSNVVSGSVVVTVNPQPERATIAAPSLHLCNGETGVITVTNFHSGYTYTWFKGGVLLTTSSLDTIHVTVAGAYTVMATSDKGCDAAAVSDTINITTGTVPTPVITGYLHVCPGGKTKLQVGSSEGLSAYELFKWTEPPDKQMLSGDSIFSSPAGRYQVRVVNEGCTDSVNVTVSADDTVFPAGKLLVVPDSIGYGGSAKLIAAVSNAVQYHWNLGNGEVLITSVDTLVANYYRAGDSIPVTLDAVSERNCISHFTASVKVSPQTTLPKSDDSFQGNLKDWNIFPVPFHDHLKVSLQLLRAQQVRIDLFTVEGSWVKTWQFSGVQGENLFTLDHLDALPSNIVYVMTGYYDGKKHFDKLFKY